VDLYGANIKPEAQVRFEGSPAAAVEWVDDGHIRFEMPGNTAPGTHTVTVINPGGMEANASIHVGTITFMPFATR
jgi:hypothetical protein